MKVPDFASSEEVAEFIDARFAATPKRLAHIQTVARSVRQSALQLNTDGFQPPIDVEEAYCAALLHDVGYLEEIAATGFHPLDGAAFLRKHGHPRLAELIIGHSNSPEQAELKGIDGVVASDDIIATLITYWDVQTKQGGEQVCYHDRLADIVDRYGEDSDVTRAHRLAAPRIERIIEQVDQALHRDR